MYDVYVDEIYGLEAISLLLADSMGLNLFNFPQRPPKRSDIGYISALRSFKVIQGNRNWYRSKARM